MQKIVIGLLLLCFNGVLLAADEEEGEAVEKTPGYVSLGEPMILNLSGSSKLTFLQLKADVLVSDDDSMEIITKHIPAIRHKLIVLLSEKSAIDLKTSSKREEIRQQATGEIRTMIEQMADNKDIEEVLFSSFLVQ